MNTRLSWLSLCIASMLAGCAGWQEMDRDVKNVTQRTEAQIDEWRTKQQEAVKPVPPQLFVRKPGVYLGSKSVALRTDEQLPSQFDKVTIGDPGRFTLRQAAQIITRRTGLPVVIAPDVDGEKNNLQGNTQTAIPMMGGGTDPQTQRELQKMALGNMAIQSFPVSFAGMQDVPLSQVLHEVAAAAGVNWEYENGQITFYRYQTRTFPVVVPTMAANTDLVVGITGSMATGTQSSGGSTSGSASTSTGTSNSSFSTAIKGNTDPWKDLESGLNSLKSATGKVILDKAAGAVTMIDGKRQVAEAEKYINEINSLYRRQVLVEVKIISFTARRSSKFGLNWTAALKRINELGNSQSLSFSAPSSSISGAGGGGLVLLTQKNGQTDLSNSELLLQALAEQGDAVVLTERGAICAHRTDTPIASIASDGYISATSAATAVAGTTTVSPGVSTSTITYGLMLRMFATIEADGRLRLEFGMNKSDLNGPLIDKQSGQSTVQLASIIANQLNQAPMLQTGQSMIVTNLQDNSSSSNKQTLNKDGNPGLGGAFTGAMNRQSLMLMITPLAIEEAR